METLRFNIATVDERNVAVWRSSPQARPDGPSPIVILCPGFGQRMSDLTIIALYLVANGATVYRFDPVDHVGLGDGDIVSYSCEGVFQSLSATLRLVRSIDSHASVRVGALSFSALSAYRLAAADPDVARVVSISGVVHGLSTLAQVLGQDYDNWALGDLPPTVMIEGHPVDPRPLWVEHRRNGCLSLDATRRHLEQITVPVANCLAVDDPWVSLSECREVFTSGDAGERLLIELPYDGHDLGRNPAAIRLVLGHAARLLLGSGSHQEALSAEIEVPDFETILDVRASERRLMREQRRVAAEMTAAE